MLHAATENEKQRPADDGVSPAIHEIVQVNKKTSGAQHASNVAQTSTAGRDVLTSETMTSGSGTDCEQGSVIPAGDNVEKHVSFLLTEKAQSFGEYTDFKPLK